MSHLLSLWPRPRAAASLAQVLVAALVAGALLQAAPARAQAELPDATPVARMTPMQLAGKFDRVYGRPVYAGLCRSGFKFRLQVHMFVPVAYIETTRRPGETTVLAPALLPLLAQVAGFGPAVAQSRLLADNTSGAHVYTIPDRLVQSAGFGLPNMVCTPSDAIVPHNPAPAESAALLTRLGTCTALADVAGEMSRTLVGAFDATVSEALCTPKPAYFSEVDLPNWRTGCGDMTITNLMQSNAVTCGIDNALAQLPIPGFGSLIGGDSCLGGWGPLFPRQMRERGLNPVAASAKTAYRALSLARSSFGSVLFAVDRSPDARMQQVYPTVSDWFAPGDELPQRTSARPAKVSPSGVYGWLYWRRVSCCVPKAGAGGCFY